MFRKAILIGILSMMWSCSDDSSDVVNPGAVTGGGGTGGAQCLGKQCGPDGRGGFCGVCPTGTTCSTQGTCGASNCTPQCTGKQCGSDGCGGICANCPAGQQCSAQGQCIACQPVCSGKQCGPDGCGGACGQCPSGWGCNGAGQCVTGGCLPTCQTKVCGNDDCGSLCGKCPPGQSCSSDGSQCVQGVGNCGAITAQGQCQSNNTLAVSCVAGQIVAVQCDSSQGLVCGFSASKNKYDCVNPSCAANCTGKQCGPDGCGGQCGKCGRNQTCNTNGLCQGIGPCTPNCTAKVCGPDGCGNLCGVCPQGQNCGPTGQCIAQGGCTPNCMGKFCGPDGCGGSCGTCKPTEQCKSSLCINPNCSPDCTGKDCGPNGCGGTCGNCADTQQCDSAQHCVTPGTGCGFLPIQNKCTPDGQAVQYCEDGQTKSQSCEQYGAGYVCGWVKAQSYYWCISSCEANCADKECGSDGCTGSCGQCGADASCSSAGKCVTGSGGNCGDIGFEGICEGNTLKWCAGGELATKNCGEIGQVCDWDPDFSWYSCVSPSGGCTPNCLTVNDSGTTVPKQCGDDGCGNSCGTCVSGLVCTDKGLCTGGTSECGSIDTNGVCEGTVLKWCNSGSLVVTDCADNDKVCSMTEFGWYSCQPPETPSGCGGIDVKGMCEGSILKWCKNNTDLQVTDCAADNKVCHINDFGTAFCK